MISNLIITSLNIYKNKYPIAVDQKYKKSFHFGKDIQESIFKGNLYEATDEYLTILNDIHLILSNCSDLSISQKLEFCNSQRYFMKLFLKDMLIKIKSK